MTLEQILQNHPNLSSKSAALISDLAAKLTIPKGQNFVHLGALNNSEYILLSGICKSYLLNPDGEEVTISFFQTGSVLSPFTTRTNRGRSLVNFKALTDLKLIALNASAFEQLMVENLEVREFGNSVLRQELMRKVQKEIGLASLTAKERLLEFRKEFPAFENLIPHTDIASYLGITNISLSRLRKALTP